MKRSKLLAALLGFLLGLGVIIGRSEAASPASTTKITLKMENENCVKRITATLRDVPNVGDVRADLAKRTATVTASGGRVPSARALWEAAEKSGHAVVQLEGPQGKFTSKPGN